MPTATERKHFVNNEQSAHHDNQAGQKKPPKNTTHLETTDTDDWQSKLNIQYLNKRQQIERSDCVVVTCSTTALQSEIVFLSFKPCQKEILKNKSISVV